MRLRTYRPDAEMLDRSGHDELRAELVEGRQRAVVTD
jgi:hypothetical protein